MDMESSPSFPQSDNRFPIFADAQDKIKFLDHLCQSTNPQPSLIVGLLDHLFHQSDEDVIKEAFSNFCDFFVKCSALLQGHLLLEFRLRGSFGLASYFCTRFGVSNCEIVAPRNILMNNIIRNIYEPRIRSSYVMAFGNNKYFNLGLPNDREIMDARMVQLPVVDRISMSDKHTLFLLRDGTVLGCGNNNYGELGSVSQRLITHPVPLKIPASGPVIDMIACSKYSVFISKTQVIICGQFSVMIKSTVKEPFIVLKLVENAKNETKLREVVAGSKDIFVFSSVQGWRWKSDDSEIRPFYGFPRQHQPASHSERELLRLELRGSFNHMFVKERFQDVVCCSVLTNDIRVRQTCSSTLSFEIPNSKLEIKVVFKLEILDGPTSIAHRRSPSKIKASFEGMWNEHECFFSLNGLLISMNILQFSCSPDGEIIMSAYPLVDEPLASLDELNLDHDDCFGFTGQRPRPIYPHQVASLYRGKAVLVEDRSHESGFVSYTEGIRALYHNYNVLFVIQEIPGTFSVRNFAASPDLSNVIYVVDSDDMSDCYRKSKATKDLQELNQRLIREKRWRICAAAYLSGEEREKLYGLQPLANFTDSDEFVQIIPETGGAVEFSFPRELLIARLPVAKEYILKGQLVIGDLLGSENNFRKQFIRYTSDYIKGICSHYELGISNSFLGKLNCVLKKAELVAELEYIDTLLIRPIRSSAYMVSTSDCELVSENGEKILCNSTMLAVTCDYFSTMAAHRPGSDQPSFKTWCSKAELELIIRIIAQPSCLLELSFTEIYEAIFVFDSFTMLVAIEDCISAMFQRVSEFNVGTLFELFNDPSLSQYRDLIADHFALHIHLLVMWRASYFVPIDLLKMVDRRLSLGQNESSSSLPYAPMRLSIMPSMPGFPILSVFGIFFMDELYSYCETYDLMDSEGAESLEPHERGVLLNWTLFTLPTVASILGQGVSKSQSEDALFAMDFNDLVVLLKAGFLKYVTWNILRYSEHIYEMSEDLISMYDQFVRKTRAKRSRQVQNQRNSRSSNCDTGELENSSLPQEIQPSSLVFEDIELIESFPALSVCSESESDRRYGHTSAEQEKSLCTGTQGVQLNIINDLSLVTTVSLPADEKKWDIISDFPKKHSPAFPDLHSDHQTPTSTTPRKTEKFISKGIRFRKTDFLAKSSKSNVAPWAGISSNTSPRNSVSDWMKVEEKQINVSPNLTRISSFNAPLTPPPRHPWTPATSSPTIGSPRLAEIMEEEINAAKCSPSPGRAFEFSACEEAAVQELLSLYRQNLGDEVVINVDIVKRGGNEAKWCQYR